MAAGLPEMRRVCESVLAGWLAELKRYTRPTDFRHCEKPKSSGTALTVPWISVIAL